MLHLQQVCLETGGHVGQVYSGTDLYLSSTGPSSGPVRTSEVADQFCPDI